MERWVAPPKRVTSPTWGPPPPSKQALKEVSRLQSQGIATPVILKLNPFAMITYAKQLKLEHCNRKMESLSHCITKRSLQANVHGFVF